MCPLRFILVFFSAVLAAYFAWKTVRSTPESETTSHGHSPSSQHKSFSSYSKQSTYKKTIENGLWVFVDMASGKYLWRNLRAMNKDIQVNKSS